MKGPLDRMLTRMAGGTTPAHVTRCYEGLSTRSSIDRADAPAEAAVPLVVADTLMTDRDAARRLAEIVSRRPREDRPRRRHRQLRHGARRAARRGGLRRRDRIARRRAGRRGRRPSSGVEGATNEDAARAADLVVLATKAEAPSRRRARCARRSGRRRCSRSRPSCVHEGGRPADGRGDLDRGPDPGRARRARGRRASTRSRPATSAATRRPRRTRSSAATTPRPRRSCSSSPSGSPRAARSTAARSRAPRALEGMTAVIVNVNKRYKAHAGLRVTGVPEGDRDE